MQKYFILFFVSTFVLVQNFAQNIPIYVPKAGLVAWWPFDGNADDESGNGNDGTVFDALLTTDRNGRKNAAYDFDGIKSYVNVGHKSNLNLAKTSFTISAWVNLDSFSPSNGSTIISNRTNIAKDSGWIFDIGGYNGKHVRKVILGSCCNNAAFSDDLTLQEWHHVVVLYNYDSQTARFYFDNKFVSTSYFSGNNFLHFGNDTLVDHTIGREINNQFSGGNNYALNGKLDDIGIWNRELSDLELKILCESCTLAITMTPINKSITIPDTTYLTVKTNDNAATYQWQIFNGTDFENINNNETYFGTNTNTLRVNFPQFSIDYLEYRCIIKHGNCTIVSDKIVLTFQKNYESPEFQMPNVFTPNNDGLNDNLMPIMKNAIILDYKIFNTYGELIFAASNLNEKSPRNQYWDGTYKNLDAPSGVYIFLVNISNFNGNVRKRISDSVTLLR